MLATGVVSSLVCASRMLVLALMLTLPVPALIIPTVVAPPALNRRTLPLLVVRRASVSMVIARPASTSIVLPVDDVVIVGTLLALLLSVISTLPLASRLMLPWLLLMLAPKVKCLVAPLASKRI